VTLTEADCRATMGVRIDDAVRLWFAREPWSDVPVAVVTERIVAGVVAHVREHGEAIVGAVEAVTTVRAAGLHIAVASSSPPY